VTGLARQIALQIANGGNERDDMATLRSAATT